MNYNRMEKVKRLLYICYWSLEDGLTQSTVLPHLKVLLARRDISEITLLTVERSTGGSSMEGIDNINHLPVFSKNYRFGLGNKLNDFRIITKTIRSAHKNYGFDLIFCRGAMAGAIAYLVRHHVQVPYVVESFEPHADYMLDAKVWGERSIKYLFQKYWEQKVMQTASAIVTVSRHYQKKIDEVCQSKVFSFGCAVDVQRFAFKVDMRQEIRSQLGISDHELVGIYVGKFGDIYYQEEAYAIFFKAFQLVSHFRLIILTPNDQVEVSERLSTSGIPVDKCFISKVPFSEVPNYLSAVDFAFSMVRPSPVRLYCSPIKDGEYWANGLPILCGDGIGEDSDIIRDQNAGAIFDDDLSNLEEAIKQVIGLIQLDRNNGAIVEVARTYRSFDLLPAFYQDLFEYLETQC